MESLRKSQGTPFAMTPRPFHTFSFFCHPGLVKRDFFQPMDSLGTPLENGEGVKPYILVELNPNILGRDVERMNSNLLTPWRVAGKGAAASAAGIDFSFYYRM